MDARIAIAQINPTVGDLKGNAEIVLENIRRAKKEGADLVVFPELALTGYPPKDLLLKKAFVEENTKRLSLILPECRGIACIIGFVDHSPGGAAPPARDPSSPSYSSSSILHNSAAFISDGKILGIQHKSELPNYDVFDENRYFEPAREWKIFKLGSIRIAVNICEDIWADGGPVEKQAKMGADLIVNISASPFYTGKMKIRTDLLRKRAVDHGLPLLYVNMVGGQDDLVFDGGSCFTDESGVRRHACKRFAEDFAIVDKSAPASPSDELEPVAEIYEALVLGIRDYVRKNSFTRVVLGLSGGIDSAVVAALASRAVGPRNVRGVMMPSRISSESSTADARRLAANLGIQTSHIPIGDVYDSYMRALREEFKATKPSAAEENIQARIRGNILMAISNKFGHLLLSTGNKSEVAVGYVTLYGDLAGGLAPLADVAKSSVYALASYINRKGGGEVIPEEIIRKEPTAELRPGQKDSDDLPPYDVLEKILHAYVEEDLSGDEIVAMGFEERVVRDVIRRADHSEHKRKQAPVSIKITPKAFGFGRRMPITNKYTS